MFGETTDGRSGYWFAKDQWERVLTNPDYIDALDPRDPHGAIEDTLVKGFNHHPIEARFVSGLALQGAEVNISFEQ